MCRPAADRFRVTLTVTAGPHQGAAYTFAEHDTFLVGRSPEAHFSLPEDPYFSRMQFLVEVNPPLCRLLDLKSSNGTFINDQRVRGEVPVHDGDLLRVGTLVFAFRIKQDEAIDLVAPDLRETEVKWLMESSSDSSVLNPACQTQATPAPDFGDTPPPEGQGSVRGGRASLDVSAGQYLKDYFRQHRS